MSTHVVYRTCSEFAYAALVHGDNDCPVYKVAKSQVLMEGFSDVVVGDRCVYAANGLVHTVVRDDGDVKYVYLELPGIAVGYVSGERPQPEAVTIFYTVLAQHTDNKQFFYRILNSDEQPMTRFFVRLELRR